MPATSASDWRKDFGLDGRNPPSLFTSKSELTSTTPQAHLLRRAFDVLQVNGILCVDNSPLAYFKLVRRITPEDTAELHRQFWNHGGAALLVLVTDDRVHVYSGMVPPSLGTGPGTGQPIEIESLNRVADTLRSFTVSVETGEYFGNHKLSFNPQGRVDRHLLDNLMRTRKALTEASSSAIPDQVKDALLCRLVFTCYLFDRGVIGAEYLAAVGIDWAEDLRGLLGHAQTTEAKDGLYRLFDRLKLDFNGDLFDSDLAAEKRLVRAAHLKTLYTFFAGMTVGIGQGTLFRLYDFAYIPIETISAIYERFLSDEEVENAAFYTPRFLAEVVLDSATADMPSLLGKRFLDPACGSGIFLVGLFHRMAEEWRRANPKANNDRRAKELMRLLRDSLFGVDVSLTACRIAAFSLYLAYLDQLTPPDIQNLQQKGRALPRLVAARGAEWDGVTAANIREGDFFSDDESMPLGVSLVVGNPPWGGTASTNTAAGTWCKKNSRPLPDKQIAAAFAWKAAEHAEAGGSVCLVLPHGILFNHSTTAVPFQAAWVRAYAFDRVINLADLRFILFEKAIHPAVVVKYRNAPPSGVGHPIDYWSPKADWTVSRAEIVTVGPQDRATIKLGELLADLAGQDAPQIWKRHYWATPRDWRLLDRLCTYSRLRDVVGQTRGSQRKRWLLAEGFQPFGQNDPDSTQKNLTLASRAFIPAKSKSIDLIIVPDDCQMLPSATIKARRLHSNPEVFRAPHVLVSKGFNKIAFADFDVAFQHALRGISGPEHDSDLLAFLAAYLQSKLARYVMFHMSSNWGIYRPEVHVEELLRAPFPLPEDLHDPSRGREIVAEVAKKVIGVARAVAEQPFGREEQIEKASRAIEPLINEYFDITPAEAALIEDTTRVIIPSLQPTEIGPRVKTVYPARPDQCTAYMDRVCKMLNGWAKRGQSGVRGHVEASQSLGVGVVVFEKVDRSRVGEPMTGIGGDLLRTLDTIRTAIPKPSATLDIVRGVMVFDGPRLYVVKPIGQRYWTQTAAMNDADEIAGTILMRNPPGVA